MDVRTRRLPSRTVLMVGALFFLDALILRTSIGDIGMHVAIALCALVGCVAMFAAKIIGGGDAKLASVIFLWAGPGLSWPALALISIIGTFVSLVSLATRHMNSDQRSRPMRALAMFSAARGVPYGVALALGGGSVIVLPALLPLFSTR
ncbi:A24 family peptidase [Paraburkholderia rhynchosiae]|uniref:A24 family peptidase n=1 Tax=Paraburkholderia rhynchosiae TaxID=487049 RepID=UPI00387E9C02